MKYQIRLLACSLLLLSPAVSLAGKKPAPGPQVSPTAISPGAAAFLDNAIDIMREHALHSQGVDWAALRTEAFKRAGGAFNPIDTYPAIYWALVQLGDPGSHLRLPPGLFPDQIALMQQAEQEALHNAPAGARAETSIPTAFTSRRLPEGHIITAQGTNYGYVALPRCTAKDNDGLLIYAADVRRILTDLSGQSPKGWIIDLRGNTGGNMWPMLTGIGPILGDGIVGSFVAADGNMTWFYQDGRTGTRNPAGLETVSLTLDDSPVLVAPSAPVAVLVDSSTASSAEAITIAFHGRPETRFFGTRTAGKSTAVQPFKLDDGAELYLTTAIDADRTGKPYPNGFTPDEIIPFNSSTMPQTSNDPVVLAAQNWLVASIPTAAPLPPAATPSRSRHKKVAAGQADIASAPPASPQVSTPAVAAPQPQVVASAPAAVAPAPVAVTPAPVAVTPAPVAVAPAPVAVSPAPVAVAPPAPVATPATVAVAPVSVAPPTPAAAPAAVAVAPVPVAPPTPAAPPAAAAQTTPPAQTTAATTPPPATAKPKAHKKVVVHEGS
jgi:carboxyl-terminal processing protease